jgi:hypothetical protein
MLAHDYRLEKRLYDKGDLIGSINAFNQAFDHIELKFVEDRSIDP